MENDMSTTQLFAILNYKHLIINNNNKTTNVYSSFCKMDGSTYHKLEEYQYNLSFHYYIKNGTHTL